MSCLICGCSDVEKYELLGTEYEYCFDCIVSHKSLVSAGMLARVWDVQYFAEKYFPEGAIDLAMEIMSEVNDIHDNAWREHFNNYIEFGLCVSDAEIRGRDPIVKENSSDLEEILDELMDMFFPSTHVEEKSGQVCWF